MARISIATGTARLPDRFDFCRVLRGVWTMCHRASNYSIGCDTSQLIHVNAFTHLNRQRKFTSLIAFPRHLNRSGAAEQSWRQHRAHWSRRDPSLDSGKMESLLEPTPDLAWVLAAEGFDPLREAIYESRFSISNGLLGLRAGRPVSRGERWVVPQRVYLAGLFDVPGPEHPIPSLVPAPGWQQIRIMLSGGPLVATPPRRFHIARHST